jgi:hypothetical protein
MTQYIQEQAILYIIRIKQHHGDATVEENTPYPRRYFLRFLRIILFTAKSGERVVNRYGKGRLAEEG